MDSYVAHANIDHYFSIAAQDKLAVI